MTAREFLTNTFNTDFLRPEELETIINAMELYAYGQCRKQRELCYEHGDTTWGGSVDSDSILNAPSPVELPTAPDFENLKGNLQFF